MTEINNSVFPIFLMKKLLQIDSKLLKKSKYYAIIALKIPRFREDTL